jgi:SAM-dependent methyltransferase
MPSNLLPTTRFTDRVDDYVRYRPGYPPQVLEELKRRGVLRSREVVVDLGSGTGIFTELLLGAGHPVFAVEPNAAMRAAAEERLGTRPGFRSLPGSAEATGLTGASADVATVAQAFHWFDPVAVRRELIRVLRGARSVVLLWNVRDPGGSDFLRDYDALVRRYALDDAGGGHDRLRQGGAIAAFFAPASIEEFHVDHAHELDIESVRGRLLSSSYAPRPGHPAHPAMMDELGALFEAHESGGRVRMAYRTEVYLGSLVAP